MLTLLFAFIQIQSKMILDEEQIDEGGDHSEGGFGLSQPKQRANSFDFDFCTMDSIKLSRRVRALQLRDQGIREFRNLKMIPMNDEEISLEPFQVDRTRNKNFYITFC